MQGGGGGTAGILAPALVLGAGAAVSVASGGTATPLVLAGLSSAASVYAGQQQSQAAAASADQAKIAQEGEQAEAAQRAAAIRQNLLQTLGSQQATLAARGIDPGRGGTAADLANAATTAATDDLRTNQSNLAQKVGQLSFQRQQLGQQGQAGLISGLVGATTTGLQAYGAYKQVGTNPGASLNRGSPVTYGPR